LRKHLAEEHHLDALDVIEFVRRAKEETLYEPIPPYFKVVYVFDIKQTEGKPLPEFVVPVLSGAANEELFSKALAHARSRGLEVNFEPKPNLDRGIKGYYSGTLIWVKPDEPRAQQLATLLHELAHYYTESVFKIPKADAETIAESASFVVGAHFGFDSGLTSFPYVALWAKDKKVFQKNLDDIRRVAFRMIDLLQKETSQAQPSTLKQEKGSRYPEKSKNKEVPTQILNIPTGKLAKKEATMKSFYGIQWFLPDGSDIRTAEGFNTLDEALRKAKKLQTDGRGRDFIIYAYHANLIKETLWHEGQPYTYEHWQKVDEGPYWDIDGKELQPQALPEKSSTLKEIELYATTRGFEEDDALRADLEGKQGYKLYAVFERPEYAQEVARQLQAEGQDIKFVKHISTPETGERPTWEIYAKPSTLKANLAQVG
jgi:hypothetical protein